MTTQELIDYYANLLIMQYIGKPRAYATIQTLVTPVVMDQLPAQVQNSFGMDGSAVGVQLDILGKYVGVTRNTSTFTGPTVLDDNEFFEMIQIKVIQNNSGSSLSEIVGLLWEFFQGAITVFDHQTMRLDYFINSSVGTIELAEVFVEQNLLPRPMGVRIDVVIFSPVVDTFFGFRTYEAPAVNVTPFNNYSSYDTASPWLSYQNNILL